MKGTRMATKEKTAKPKTKTKTSAKAKPSAKAAAKSNTKTKSPNAKSKGRSTKPTAETVALAAGPSDDPMGCCTWTNSGGQLMMRNMKKSQCAKITGSTFEAGGKCNG